MREGRGVSDEAALSERLTAGGDALGLKLSEAQVRSLLTYLAAVLERNERVNVTSVRDPLEAVTRHLLDSLSIVPIWHDLYGPRPPKRVLDLGTGGGFPGAPLAIAWPRSRVLMIDGTGKKVRIVNESLEIADVPNAQALQCRGADLPKARPNSRRGFELCVARAVGRAGPLLAELAPLVAHGGRILLMKGPNPPSDELKEAAREIRRRHLVAEPSRETGVPGGERGQALIWRRR